MRRSRADRRLEGIVGRSDDDRRPRDAAERRPRDGSRAGESRGQSRAQAMPGRLIVDIEDTADRGTVGVQRHHEPYSYASPDLEPGFEGRHAGPGGESPDLDRARRAHQPVARGRAVRVGVTRVAAVFDAEQIHKTLPRAAVVQRAWPGGLGRDLDSTV